MKKKIFKILKNEFVLYIIVGFFTTIINWGLFFSINNYFEIAFQLNDRKVWFIPECFAFLIATMFAFLCDKFFVFKASFINLKKFLKEMGEFFSLRIFSEIINVFGMFILINLINVDVNISKISLGIVVIVLNYLFSKFIIFKKK